MMKRIWYSGPPLRVLHRDYAKQGRIDEQAPLQTSSTIWLDAPVERVWAQLINLAAWPTIAPAFRHVQLTGPVAVDRHFSFVLNHFPIKAQFAVVTANQELCWTGSSLWFKAVDHHRLTSTPDGGTYYTMTESFAGHGATLLMSASQLQQQHARWLAAFQQALSQWAGAAPEQAPGFQY